MKNLLPNGSVVLLNDGKKRIMIYGRVQKSNDSGKLFDYAGCFYPEGIMNTSEVMLFNHEDIKTLFFIGFQDPEEFAFRQVLNEFYEKESKE